MAISQDVIRRVRKRSGDICEICNIGYVPKWSDPTEYHHCLVRRAKKHPEYDHEINLQLCHRSCHEHKANTRQNEINHYQRVCEYYGKSVVEDWINSLGLKSREYWD